MYCALTVRDQEQAENLRDFVTAGKSKGGHSSTMNFFIQGNILVFVDSADGSVGSELTEKLKKAIAFKE